VRLVAVAALATAVMLSVTACASTTDPTAVAAPASQLPAANIQGTLVLRALNTAQAGQVVVDGRGYVLYRFDKDTAKPPRSNCLEECVPKWPPVLDTSDIRLDGVDQALVGSVVRADFTRQVTIAGWPVYRYSGDRAPGEAKGQGVGNLWFAVTPQGKKAATAAGNANAPSRGAATPAAGNGGG
jgi:predicted lipoprotein with Yx(FWY)xxD motif